MKKFKFFAILLIFSLSIVGSSLLFSPSFNFSNAEEPVETKPPVKVNNSNAQEVFSQPWMYSSITLTEDITTPLTINAKTNAEIFNGLLDGNGYTIYNIDFSSVDGGYNLGLIPYAEGAIIKNLKIGGVLTNYGDRTNQITYQFAEDYSELYSGIIVGTAVNSQIENCEIDIVNADGNKDINLDLNKGVDFGGIVGKSVGSNLKNIIVNANFNFTVKSTSTHNFGGIVGTFSSSTINKSLIFGGINITGSGENAYCGGLIGFAQNTTSIIKDNASSATINSSFAKMGAIVGQVSSASKISKSNINYNYWTANLKGVGVNGDDYNSNTYMKQLDVAFNSNFLSNDENFNSGFDFKTIFCVKNSKITLQRFQKFSLSFASNKDSIIEDINFVINGEKYKSYTIGYGEKVKIEIILKDDVKNDKVIENVANFYRISEILVSNSSRMEDLSQAISKNNSGFDITFIANDWTCGDYDIHFATNTYQGEFVVQQIDGEFPGELSFGNSLNSFEQNLTTYTINSDTSRIYAEPKEQSYYLFSHWNLYYIVNGEEVLQGQENESWWNGNYSTLASIKINFGQAPFNQNFKLEAVFSNEGGVDINLINIDKNNIDSISVQGILFKDQAIKISKYLTNAEFKVVTKKGYDLDTNKLVQNLSNLYDSSVTEEEIVKKVVKNEDGTTEYTLNINIAKIYEKDNLEKINIEIPTIFSNNGGKNSLLWLWITIPSLVVVGGAIFLIVYIKKRNIAKNNVKKKREANYKDFYS